MPAERNKATQKQAKSDTAKEKHTFSEMIAQESDVLRRCALLNFSMDAMKSPEDAFMFWNVPDGMYETWAEKHFTSLVEKVAQQTGADPAQIADKDMRTPEQQKLMLEISGREQIARIEMYLRSNYMIANKHIEEYCLKIAEAQGTEDIYQPLRDERYPIALLKGNPVNVPLAAVLYFFATHEAINPQAESSLTKEDKSALIDIFSRLDDFYKEHRAELHNEQELLQLFIDASNSSPERARETYERIVESVRLKDFDFPIDKVNKTIWRLLEKHSTGDQIAIHMEAHASKDPVLLYYAISFDELENQGITITKKLTAFEKRVYIAAGALYAIKGQKPFTYTELYYAMGYTGKPGSNDLEKLAAAITKMGGAWIYVNNQQEIDAKYNYPRFIYDGHLLPMERVTAIVDGKITDAAIHLFREPPLIAFARQREQITQINIKLLQSPASKTEANIALEDYLIERIAQARNERRKLEKKRCKTDAEKKKKEDALKVNPRILFATLYEHADITTVKQKQRAPEKVKRILEHYKACSFIRDFEIDATGVTITL